MASEFIDLQGNRLGLAESEAIAISSDSEMRISYDATKCYSAWVEVTTLGLVSRFPFIPPSRSNSAILLPSGSSAKVVASMGLGGSLKATVVY